MKTTENIILALLLFVVTPLVLFFAKSTVWAAMVPAGTAFVGLLSKENFGDKLVTMAATAQGLGLIFTL